MLMGLGDADPVAVESGLRAESIGRPLVSFISEAAVVLEYDSVYDVHTPLDPDLPVRSQPGSFDTATILDDLTDWIDPSGYDFVFLYSLDEIPGGINSGSRGVTTPAKNIGLYNPPYGQGPNYPAWSQLYSAGSSSRSGASQSTTIRIEAPWSGPVPHASSSQMPDSLWAACAEAVR